MRRYWIIGSVLLLLLIGGGIIYWQQTTTEPEQSNTPEATRTEVIPTGFDNIRAEGVVVARQSVALVMQESGTITEIFVKEGDFVDAGEPIFQLDTTTADFAIEQAGFALAQAETAKQTALAALDAGQDELALAETAVIAANIRLEALLAPPTPEQLALAASEILLAEADIENASANQASLTQAVSEAELLAAQAQLQEAQATEKILQDASGDLYRNEITGEIVQDVAIQLNAAVAAVNAAQAQLDALSAGATLAQRQAALANVEAAQAQQVAAQAQLELLLAGAKAEEVEVAEIAVLQAQATVSQTAVSLAILETDVAEAETAVLMAQLNLTALETQRDNLTLRAPFAGILTELPITIGEQITFGDSVGTLADTSQWFLQTIDLTELEVIGISSGMTAQIELTSHPDIALEGIVEAIALVPTETRGDVTYEVTILLTETDRFSLRSGMTGVVTIDTNN